MHIPDHCPLDPGATVWGYLRDSGGDRQDRSIAQQREVLEAYCERHGLVLERVFADEARPGDSAETRDALWEMIDEARERFPQIHDRRRREEIAARRRHGIITWSLARLGRDREETRFLRADLQIRGLAIISLSDEMLTGNEDIDPIVTELLAFKAALDLRTISREAKRGLHHVVSLRDNAPGFLEHHPGHKPTGCYLGIAPLRVIPVGFQAERITIGRRRDGSLHRVQRLLPDPETRERVRLAWRMRVEDGVTYREIHEATHLYDDRNLSSYSSFFTNRIYTGVFRYGDEVYGSPEDPFVEPLIPVEWFEREQKRRAKRATRRRKGGERQPGMPDPRIRSNGRLLSGLLVCARCGSNMHVGRIKPGWIDAIDQPRTEYNYYVCSRASNDRCDAGKVKAERLEKVVLRELRRTILNPDKLRAYFDELLVTADESLRRRRERLAVLKEQLSGAEREVENLADAIAARPASQALLRRLDEAEACARQLRDDVLETEAYLTRVEPQLTISDADIDHLITEMFDILGKSGDDIRNPRLVLEELISRIEVDPTKRIGLRIVLRTPKRWLSDMPPGGIEPPFRP